MKWIEVSSSSWQRGHTALFRRPIILRCRLRSAWPVSNPTRILKSFFSRLKAKRARTLTGVFKNSLACLHLGSACNSLLCSWIAHEFIELRIVEVLISTDGSGLVKHEQEACLASRFTLSIPQCPGTPVAAGRGFRGVQLPLGASGRGRRARRRSNFWGDFVAML